MYFKLLNLIIREIIMSWICVIEKWGIIQKLYHEVTRKKLDGWVQSWKDYIKYILKEMDFGSTEWIQLNWNRNAWWAVVIEVSTALNYSVMIKISTFCIVFIAWFHFYWEKSILFIKQQQWIIEIFIHLHISFGHDFKLHRIKFCHYLCYNGSCTLC